MFGDDLALFKSLRARMLRDFSDLSLPITVAPHDGGGRLLEDEHKLKAAQHDGGQRHALCGASNGLCKNPAAT